ncbi:MAG: PilN domain-containing protein [Pseudomonas sp.]|uniref:type II secretion system protein GspL n=1 Tax=Pseudomonas abieticivorans TaxID=2931382 RepID=UPI0020C0768D|nr:PilN domain-containing protein [Pseudomonas sp. PIA16]MDE1168092.1 PilN domain-containing protein [Pseudomonas sp.]
MKASLNTHLAPLLARWRGSPAQRAWQLWLEQLQAMLPARFRMGSGQAVHLLHWPLAAAPVPASDTAVVLLLPRSSVLVQRLRLPLAAAKNLDGVLGFELDKYTPYRSEQLYFCTRVEGKSATGMRVLLVAILRESLQAMLADCQAQGVTLQGIDVADGNGGRLGVELMPDALRTVKSSTQGRLNRSLALACAVLTVACMVLWLNHRQALLAQMQSQVQAQRQQVAQLQQLRQALANSRGAANYLIQRKVAQPTVAAVLNDLTHCLPADTWVEQLEINDAGQVSFSGQSAKASALIGNLKACQSLDNPQFQGVIQPDSETGKDRFSLRARLHREAADHAQP